VSVALLDVNMLVALAWPTHIHHRQAHAWFRKRRKAGWATCPMTQCAFVRISSNPKILPDAVSPPEAMAMMDRIAAYPHHEFWPDTLPLSDAARHIALLAGHRQITDAYLLGLAIEHGGRLATLDRGLRALLPQDAALGETIEVVAT